MRVCASGHVTFPRRRARLGRVARHLKLQPSPEVEVKPKAKILLMPSPVPLIPCPAGTLKIKRAGQLRSLVEQGVQLLVLLVDGLDGLGLDTPFSMDAFTPARAAGTANWPG